MDWKLELVIVPVTDVERAKAFYVERIGFALDVDVSPTEGIRVVQLTPPGSACSIAIGTGIGQSEPGSTKGLHLVVTDVEAPTRSSWSAASRSASRSISARKAEPTAFTPPARTTGRS